MGSITIQCQDASMANDNEWHQHLDGSHVCNRRFRAFQGRVTGTSPEENKAPIATRYPQLLGYPGCWSPTIVGIFQNWLHCWHLPTGLLVDHSFPFPQFSSSETHCSWRVPLLSQGTPGAGSYCYLYNGFNDAWLGNAWEFSRMANTSELLSNGWQYGWIVASNMGFNCG